MTEDADAAAGTAGEAASGGPGATEGAKHGRPSTFRRIGVYALVVVAALLILVSVFATWAKTVLLDTDVWVDTSSQFLADDTIRPALATYLVDELFGRVDVQGQLQTALPGQLQGLAGPATAALRGVATDSANAVLQAPRVQQAWERANRTARSVRAVGGRGDHIRHA